MDFYCKDLKLAIEVDGESHHYGDNPEKDRIRQKRLESLGVRFIRFDDMDVKKNMAWVLEEIMIWIKENTPNEPTPNPSEEGSP